MFRLSTSGVSGKVDEHGFWDDAARCLGAKTHYPDPFLGELKCRVYGELLARWKGILPAGRVLKTDLFEEATGPHGLLNEVASHGAFMVGMDISLVSVRKAQIRDVGRQSRYVVADVRHPPFFDGAFSLVFSPSTLDHFSDPKDLGRSLQNLAKILEHRGHLIVTLDNRQNIFDPLLRIAIRLGLTPFFIGKSYSVRQLRSELEAAGMKVEDTTAILHNPRLLAVAAVWLTHQLRWRWLISRVRSALRSAQALEGTRLRYLTGSFVAANAVRIQPALNESPSEFRH
jgi:SAM-dependent methyltransferase